MRQVSVAMLNVVMARPHNPDRYHQLMRIAFRLRRAVKVRGDSVAFLGGAERSEDTVEGQIFRYVDLDAMRDWYNTQTGRAAEPSELDQLQIPTHLKPHFKTFPYIFDLKTHRIGYISRDGTDGMSPGSAAKFLSRLFRTQEIVSSFGEVEVLVEPHHSQLQKIFHMHRVQSLVMHLETPPNADDFDLQEVKFMQRMEELNVKKQTLSLTSKAGESIVISSKLRHLAETAQHNGHVQARGEDAQGRKISIATSDIPFEESIPFEPKLQSRIDALREKFYSMLNNVRRRTNP